MTLSVQVAPLRGAAGPAQLDTSVLAWTLAQLMDPAPVTLTAPWTPEPPPLHLSRALRYLPAQETEVLPWLEVKPLDCGHQDGSEDHKGSTPIPPSPRSQFLQLPLAFLLLEWPKPKERKTPCQPTEIQSRSTIPGLDSEISIRIYLPGSLLPARSHMASPVPPWALPALPGLRHLPFMSTRLLLPTPWY